MWIFVVFNYQINFFSSFKQKSMKNLFLFPLAAFLILAGCTQDNVQTEATLLTKEQRFQAHFDLMKAQFAKSGAMAQSIPSDSRATCNKVPVCHNGNYIVVNKNAVPAHLAHGDQLTCCGEACIDGSQTLKNGGPFTFYYDTEVNDCLGFIGDGYDENVILGFDGGDSGVSVESYTYLDGTTDYFIYEYVNYELTCSNFEATQAEFECAVNYLRSYINANACIPNFCDLDL